MRRFNRLALAVGPITCPHLNSHQVHLELPINPWSSISYSSQTLGREPPQLKVQLRELYKRVHPDLFHDIPFARQANEHSFKLLQVY